MLDQIISAKRLEMKERKAKLPVNELLQLAATPQPTRRFARALKRGPDEGIRLIAEFKRASPSKGEIRTDLSPVEVARQCAEAGAVWPPGRAWRMNWRKGTTGASSA